MTKGMSKGMRIGAHFALAYNAVLVLVKKLDGILDRNNMAAPVLIYMVDHGSQGRRFAASCRTCDQDQPPGLHGHIFQDRGKLELINGEGACRDDPDGRSPGASLEIHIDPETGEAGHAVGKVQFFLCNKPGLLLVGKYAFNHAPHHVGSEHLVGNGGQFTVNSYHRRAAGLQVEIRCSSFHHYMQEILDCHFLFNNIIKLHGCSSLSSFFSPHLFL